MGVQAASAQLFYDFCLDDHVLLSDHLLRSIDPGIFDFEELRRTLEALLQVRLDGPRLTLS